MQTLTDYDELPDDEEMVDELRWAEEPGDPDSSLRDPVDSLIHERTGTKVDIYENDDGDYSVQTKKGGHNIDAVVQPDDPNRFVSGTTGVLSVEEDSLATARALAMAWMMGWKARLHSSDKIRDLEA